MSQLKQQLQESSSSPPTAANADPATITDAAVTTMLTTSTLTFTTKTAATAAVTMTVALEIVAWITICKEYTIEQHESTLYYVKDEIQRTFYQAKKDFL